ncbi:hypothetical protein [Cypionkella psychrotolerans]|uniref:hypothetical protein n=1 Tax=Cypionkella psychrotolerans TaxID=1678131 RepID=UPI0006B6406B|nr:hypothetical protein [Cypionkella psychrotolerans]
MSRQINLTTANDTFSQSSVANNVALQIFGLAGDDVIILDRTDDLGGSNRVDTGIGNDAVVSHKEFDNIILLGDGNDTYVGLGFGSFSTDRADQVFAGAGNDTFGPVAVSFRFFESNTRHQGDRIWQRYTATNSSGMRFASREPVA